MSERRSSSRATAGGAGSARKTALQRLAEAKKNGARQLDSLDLAEEMVYDEVSEEEYRRLVSSRRTDADFVIDGGLGYADDGEENWDEDDPGAMEERARKKRLAAESSAKRSRLRAGHASSSASAPAPKRVSNAFLRSKRRDDGPRAPAPPSRATGSASVGSASLLNSLLAGLREDPTGNGEDTPDDAELEAQQNLEETALYDASINVAHQNVMRQRVEELHASTAAVTVSDSGRAAPPPAHQPARPVHAAAPAAKQEEASRATHDADAAMPMDDDSLPIRPEVALKREEKRPDAPLQPPLEDDVDAATRQEGEDWNRIAQKTNDAPQSSCITTAPSELLNSTGALEMFWIDAHEDTFNFPGRVYLVGKVAVPNTPDAFASCCIIVNNVERNLYILPRPYRVRAPGSPNENVTDEEIGMRDVYEELKQVTSRHGIKKWKSKVVTRKYAFENEDGLIPPEAQYLKLVYSASYPAITRNTCGETFSHVFGSKSSSLELFLLKRRLMGPCWLRVEGAQVHAASVSTCKVEFSISSPKQISVCQQAAAAPPLRVLSLSLQCHFNAISHCNEIVAASCLVHNAVHCDLPTLNTDAITHSSAVRGVKGDALPLDLKASIEHRGLPIHTCVNERALISWLLSKIGSIDPDVVVAHNLYGFVLDVLLHRCNALKVPHWSRVSRLRRSHMPRLKSGGAFSAALSACAGGRLLVDTQSSAKELVRQPSYSLQHLSRELLGMNRTELTPSQVLAQLRSSNSVLSLLQHCENDAFLSLRLMFHLAVLPLTKQLTSLGGNLWQRSLQSARAERVEFLLLHEFHREKYIVPEKYTSRERKERDGADSESSGRRKAAYAGGLVLEPKKGFYDTFILLLDFNSLYPSIIQEYNLCFTTVQHWQLDEEGMAKLPTNTAVAGILPRVIRTLVERRRSVKSLMSGCRDPVKAGQFDIRQKALKLVANSMYGCLGFSHSRFYCKPIAALVTSQGRHILSSTLELTESLGHNVIYGDTDSIMVDTGTRELNDVREIGRVLKREVNQRYRGLQIEIDGIYQSMLLLQKKKYAALLIQEAPDGSGAITTKPELKGLDMVRRDWCPLSKQVGKYVVGQILSGQNRDDVVTNIHDYLVKIAESVNNNLVPLANFVITKSITKRLQDYPNGSALPHVHVAQQMLKLGMPVCVGDLIPYVTCEDASSSSTSAALRSYHPSMLRSASNKLSLDRRWYLEQQVLPPIARLCAPIEGTDVPQLAHCLGLDPAQFRSHQADEADAHAQECLETSICVRNLDDDEAFKDVTPLRFRCPFCQHTSTFAGALNFDSNRCGLVCPAPDCPSLRANVDATAKTASTSRLLNELKGELRAGFVSHVERFYAGWRRCSDDACAMRSRQPDPFGRQQCRRCHSHTQAEYPESALFLQLRFYQTLLDFPRLQRRIQVENKRRVDRQRGEVQLSLDNISPEHRHILSRLKAYVDEEMLRRSAYYYLRAEDIFGMFGHAQTQAQAQVLLA